MIPLPILQKTAAKSRYIALRNRTRYYYGKECELHPGYNGIRYTSNSCCVKCSKDKQTQKLYVLDTPLKLTRADSIQMDRELESSLKEVWE